ncbi:LemA family protein [Mycoplasmopsis agalactiae]|uniref:LemA family protein n=1 Tax=Mycoplasmopsis agalactiae TaxID=2110 RepID=UPI002F932309
MANQLDELTDPVNPQGRDVNVIHKQIPAKVTWRSTLFEVILWLLLIIPGIIFLFKKVKAKNYLQKLEQEIQAKSSTIDAYLLNRVNIMNNAVSIAKEAVRFETEVLEKITAYRSGVNITDANRAQVAEDIDKTFNSVASTLQGLRNVNVQFERYPELKAHELLHRVMDKNRRSQAEITAARELYNDTVAIWNKAIFEWPTKATVASKEGYTTRVPFSVSQEIKERANANFMA